jgi:hypothetical protein
MCTVLSLCLVPDDLIMDASDGLIPIHDAVALDVLHCIVFVHLCCTRGPVHPAYNPYFSACFFSRNNIFLSQ